MDAGIDLGSTYTTISVYRKDTAVLEAMMEVDSPSIPSVALLTGSESGKMVYGRVAKKKTGKKNTRTFKAFKMLLPETDPKILSSRGYDDRFTPAEVAKGFLNNYFKMALKNFGHEQIDNLVICAPEIWTESVSTADGRPILRDICSGFDYIHNVKVISEPCAASAYFAHNYETITGQSFHGHILLVDYGGGTLDITLTQVENGRCDDGSSKMEIKVNTRTGAGENTDGRIGKAGVAFMEAVVRTAIVKAGLTESEDQIPSDSAFLVLADTLEESLISRVAEVADTFNEIGIDELEDLEDEEFDSLEYDGEDVPITYATLVTCYNQIIKPILAQKLREMMDYMKEHHIAYDDPNTGDFKIAQVGGFSNFYLVQQQIRDMFGFSSLDKRCSDIIRATSDRELAVSYGAALIASGKVSIRSTAPYSVGVCAIGPKGKVSTQFAINLRQEIEYNKPYFQCTGNGQKQPFVLQSGSISKLIINTRPDIRAGLVIPLKQELSQRLCGLVSGPVNTAYIAFSMDESEVLSIHVMLYDMIEDKIIEKKTVELTRFHELLELAEVIPIVSD